MCFSYLQYSRGLSFLPLADQQLFYTKFILYNGVWLAYDCVASIYLRNYAKSIFDIVLMTLWIYLVSNKKTSILASPYQ